VQALVLPVCLSAMTLVWLADCLNGWWARPDFGITNAGR